MTDRLRDDQLDHDIRSFLAWRAEDIADAPTATEVAMGIKARSGTRPGVPRLSGQLAWLLIAGLLVVGLIGAAVVGANLLRDERALVVLDPTASAAPTASARPTTTPAPLATYVVGNFLLPFEYAVPDGVELNPTTVSDTMYALTEGSSSTYPGAWHQPVDNTRGITVAFSSDAVTHSDLGRADITLEPDSFFEDLRMNPSLDIGPVAATQLSGLLAEEVEVRHTGEAAYADIHLEGPADESPLLQVGFPGTLTVARVNGSVLLVHVWAADADELDEWLPTAKTIVGSIRILDAR